MAPEYIPSPRVWVRDQVERYEASGGTEATTLRHTGLPVVIVTNTGRKPGAIRKTQLMRVENGDNSILVGSVGGAPKNPSGSTTFALTRWSRSAIARTVNTCAGSRGRRRAIAAMDSCRLTSQAGSLPDQVDAGTMTEYRAVSGLLSVP
jgi:hypothetical protein